MTDTAGQFQLAQDQARRAAHIFPFHLDDELFKIPRQNTTQTTV